MCKIVSTLKSLDFVEVEQELPKCSVCSHKLKHENILPLILNIKLETNT